MSTLSGLNDNQVNARLQNDDSLLGLLQSGFQLDSIAVRIAYIDGITKSLGAISILKLWDINIVFVQVILKILITNFG